MSVVQIHRDDKGFILYENTMVNMSTPTAFKGMCNSITFINKGTSIAIVNGLKLNPEQSLSLDGNFAEVDNTTYNLAFDTTSGNFNNLVVIRKTYQ